MGGRTTRCHPRRVGGPRGGSAILETAVVLPVLLMLSLGMAQYGYYFYLKNTFQGAAQAGARAAIPATATNASVTGAGGVVTNMLTAAGIPAASYTVTLSPSDISTASAGTQVRVTISASWGTIGVQTLAPALGGISPVKSVTGVGVMVKEGT